MELSQTAASLPRNELLFQRALQDPRVQQVARQKGIDLQDPAQLQALFQKANPLLAVRTDAVNLSQQMQQAAQQQGVDLQDPLQVQALFQKETSPTKAQAEAANLVSQLQKQQFAALPQVAKHAIKTYQSIASMT